MEMRFTYWKFRCGERRTLKPEEKLEVLVTWEGRKTKSSLENMQANAFRGTVTCNTDI